MFCRNYQHKYYKDFVRRIYIVNLNFKKGENEIIINVKGIDIQVIKIDDSNKYFVNLSNNNCKYNFIVDNLPNEYRWSKDNLISFYPYNENKPQVLLRR